MEGGKENGKKAFFFSIPVAAMVDFYGGTADSKMVHHERLDRAVKTKRP